MTRIWLAVAAMAATSVAFAQTPFDAHGVGADCAKIKGGTWLERPAGDSAAPLVGPCWMEVKGRHFDCTFTLASEALDYAPSCDFTTGMCRIAGSGLELYDYGELGKMGGWEIFNVVTAIDSPTMWSLYGASLSGPGLEGVYVDTGEPRWGTGAFTQAVLSTRWRGEMHFNVEKPDGSFVDQGYFPLEEATLCGADWAALQNAK